MERKKKIQIITLLVAIFATPAFIFGNSLEPVEKSLESSNGIYDTVKPTLDAVFGEGKVTSSVFRQSAHFIEFFILGLEVAVLYYVAFDLKKERWVDLVSAGLFVAVIDESLQMLTDRGPEIPDVLIDYSGYLIAVICIVALTFIIKYIKKKKNEKKNLENSASE